MPSYVVKPKPDDDFYVYWSTIVEGPTNFGPHSAMIQDPEITAERLDRADRTGTSCEVGFFAWDEDDLIYEQRGTVNRVDLRAFCELLVRDEAAAIARYVHPFEEEDQ